MSDKAAARKLLQGQQKCAFSNPPFSPQGTGRRRECSRRLAGEVHCWGWAILPKEKDRLLPGRQFKGSLGGKGGKILAREKAT